MIIINDAFAKRYWPNEDPIGRRITIDYVPDERPREVIAIVGNTRTNRYQKDMGPMMYVPHGQQTTHWEGPGWNARSAMTYVLRTTGDPLSLVSAVRSAVAEIDSSKPIAEVRTLEASLNQQTRGIRVYVLLLGIFGAVAAVLAAVGIYGVMAYLVAQRNHEIGIRMALGASAWSVLGLVGKQAAILVSLGLSLGLAGAFALSRLLASALFGVTATDPLTYTAVALGLVLVALLACLIPARRAATVDPNIALRYQ